MTRKILYGFAATITVLSIVLDIVSGHSFGGYYLSLGSSAVVALIMFGEAWKRGRNPEKPFYQVVLFGLGGLFSPVLAEILILGIDNIDFEFIVGLLLFLTPIISASLIGYFTRKRVNSERTRMLLNGLPGFLFIGIGIGLMVRDYYAAFSVFGDLVPLSFFALVTVLSAYAEAQTDAAERRKIQWNIWQLFLLLEILVGLKSITGRFYYEHYSFIVFSTALHIMLPVLLWYWKKWMFSKEYSQTRKTICYFVGAFLLSILQAGGLYYLMSSYHFTLSAEWVLIGIVLVLVVYWQKPMKATVAGAVGSTGLVIGLFGLLFATNERLREIFYDLGGPAVNIDLSTRADWLGYRINAVKEFVTGGYMLPFVLVLFALTVVVAVLMVRLAQNKKLASVVAIGLVVQATLYGIEEVAMFSGVPWLPFTGYFVAEYVLLRWMVNPMPVKPITANTEASATENRHTRIKAVMIALLTLMVFSECVHSVYVNTDIDETVLESYCLTTEDAKEWNAAAEQIVQMIATANPYYIAENRAELPEEEREEWQTACVEFAKAFLATDQLQPESVRDKAGQRYIKSSVVHTFLEDDTNFRNEEYTPFARLPKLKVKRLESPVKLLYCINGSHSWITYDEFTDEEKAERELLYNQVEVDYPEFFKNHDEPLLRYCFEDAILALQAQENIGDGE